MFIRTEFFVLLALIETSLRDAKLFLIVTFFSNRNGSFHNWTKSITVYLPIAQLNMDGMILQRVQWHPAYKRTVTQSLDPGSIFLACNPVYFSLEVEGNELKSAKSSSLGICCYSSRHHSQFSHFCNRKKMLKSNNQGRSQPAPAAWSCCAEWQWRSQRKKKEKDREKRGRNFLLKLDLFQLARRGGFLNACETWLLF